MFVADRPQSGSESAFQSAGSSASEAAKLKVKGCTMVTDETADTAVESIGGSYPVASRWIAEAPATTPPRSPAPGGRTSREQYPAPNPERGTTASSSPTESASTTSHVDDPSSVACPGAAYAKTRRRGFVRA